MEDYFFYTEEKVGSIPTTCTYKGWYLAKDINIMSKKLDANSDLEIASSGDTMVLSLYSI